MNCLLTFASPRWAARGTLAGCRLLQSYAVSALYAQYILSTETPTSKWGVRASVLDSKPWKGV